MQHYSNCFVQILVIRSKYQGGKDGPGGAGEKNFRRAAALLPPTSRSYAKMSDLIPQIGMCLIWYCYKLSRKSLDHNYLLEKRLLERFVAQIYI